MVFGNRHLVVVNYNNNARAEFRRLVKAFKRLTARERAIAYYGYNVFIGSFNVASLLQPCGKADGCGGVANFKVVILRTFCW